MTKNWDTKTADSCRLPELIPDICDRCRDKLYCYRQLSIEDVWREQHESTAKMD